MDAAAPEAAEARREIAELGRILFARRLLDTAGGNLSVRVADGLFAMSPAGAGSRRFWQLEPADVLLLDGHGAVIAGDGAPSREHRMHLAAYGALPLCGAVCHAHPYNLLAFACAEARLPPSSEQTEKFGTVGLARYERAHSEELAGAVAEALTPLAGGLRSHAIACLLPRHGIVIAGRTLRDACDTLERLDTSAHVHIARGMLSSTNTPPGL